MFENYNPCGPGTVWDAAQQRCVPAIPQSQLDPVFNNQLWGNPALNQNQQQTVLNPYPTPQRRYNVFTDPNPMQARPMQNQPVLIDGNGQVSQENRPGRVDGRGNWVSQPNVNNQALDQGFNYDSDGVYRKTEITEDPNLFWYNDDFQQLNFGLDAVRGVANTINTARASRKERQKYLKSLQPDSSINPYESGLNNVPVYMAAGGKNKYAVGGEDDPKKAKLTSAELAAWNNLVNFAQSKKLDPSKLDKDPTIGFALIDEYNKANPDAQFNKNRVTDIQNLMLDYRQRSIDRMKSIPADVAKKAGQNYIKQFGEDFSGFMPGLSQVDNFPGSKTLSWKVPEEYIQVVNPQQTNLQRVGFATASLQKGGNAKYAAELEQGEVFTDVDGNINKIPESHPRHEQGGSVQFNVDRVLEDTSDKRTDKVSKSLLISPDEANQLVGFKPKSSKSHSKLYEIAEEKLAKKTKNRELQLDKNLDYVKYQNGDIFAQNSIDENIKFLNKMPNPEDLFDTLYNHQEAVKYMNDYDDIEQMMCGGKKRRKYAVGGYNDPYEVDPYKGGKTKKGRTTPKGKDNAFAFEGGLNEYKKIWKQAGIDLSAYKTNAEAQSAVYDHLLKTNPDVIRKMWNTYGNTNAGITAGLPTTFDDTYLADPNNLKSLKQGYVDNMLGVRTLVPPTVDNPTPATTPSIPSLATPPINPNLPLFDRPNPAVPSQVNSPLGYGAGLGNVLGYISALERTPVDLEQVQRDPLRVHEVNPMPALQANQGDFNALINQLPNSGVGYANMANLSANKYAANNQILGQYENTNKQRYDQVDQYNDQAQWQTDIMNLQLRDQFNNRVLTSKEKQRLQKTEYLNSILRAIDDRNAFDRNAELMLQLSPYFNERGEFNGNNYQPAQRYVVPGGNTVEITAPDATGQRFRIIRDKDGKLVSNTKVIQNKSAVQPN